MKLTDLHPNCKYIGEKLFALHFDCPKCGDKYKIEIYVSRIVAAGIYNTTTWIPFDHPKMKEQPDIKVLTLMGTVANNTHGQPHPACGWSGTVINGEVS
jgi:hypothetical protein